MDISNKLCMGCMEPREGGGVCPYCGFDINQPYNKDYIPPGTFLDSRYIIGELKESNGESGTYLGYDTKENKPVWIKEYFPTTIAARDISTLEVIPKVGFGAQYKALLSDFVELCNEVRKLSISEPVIPIENMLGENNTIYIVREYIGALSLEEYLVAAGGRIPLAKAKELLIPVINGIDNIHLHGMIHRGISPYTIFIDESEKVYIDGFALSSVRTGGSELKSELFSGYSAPEQYLLTGWQGTWTDVYAISTVFYRTVSGVVPPKSTRITSQMPLTPLADLLVGVPQDISDAIARGMEPSAQLRTQTVATLLSDLLAEEGVPRTEVFDPGRIPLTFSEEPVEHDYPKFISMEHTEEISTPAELEKLKSTMMTNRPQHEVAPMLDYDTSVEDEPYPPENKSKNKFLLFTIVGITLLVAILLAFIVNGKLNLSSKPSKKPVRPEASVSSGDDPAESDETETAPEPDTPTESAENKIELPDFKGKELSAVEHNPEYTDKMYFAVKFDFSDTVNKGVIIEQSPSAGTSIPKGGSVVLTVSKGSGKMVMPDLKNMEYEQALQELARAAKELGIDVEDMNVHRSEKYDTSGKVTGERVDSTNPVAGVQFNPTNDRIDIFVLIEVPATESTKTEKELEKEKTSIPTVRGEDGLDVGVLPPKH